MTRYKQKRELLSINKTHQTQRAIFELNSKLNKPSEQKRKNERSIKSIYSLDFILFEIVECSCRIESPIKRNLIFFLKHVKNKLTTSLCPSNLFFLVSQTLSLSFCYSLREYSKRRHKAVSTYSDFPSIREPRSIIKNKTTF